MALPRLQWGSQGQSSLEMVVEYPPNVSGKHLAASSLMGEQREVLALIISHWNECSVCVRAESFTRVFFLSSSPPSTFQFKQPTNKKHWACSAYGKSLHSQWREFSLNYEQMYGDVHISVIYLNRISRMLT